MKLAIDYWCNLFTPEAIQISLDSPDMGYPIRWWRMEDRWKGMSPLEFIRMMDEAGVEKVMLPSAQMYSFQLRRPVWDFKVEHVHEVVRLHPDRFLGLYGINPFMKMDGVKELETAVHDYDFKGAHLHTYGFDKPVNHRDYWPFYAKCAELDVPVVIQVGHSAEFMPSELGRPMLLDDIALYFPELRIVGAHTGWPWVQEMIALAWKHPNVFIGTSAHAPRYWDKELISFLKTRGKGRVLFGTDWPVLTHKDALQQIADLGLGEDAESQLVRETAIKVFRLHG